ncbi:hypothetical protein ACIGEP_15560 [Microbacterium sp. NPDC077663]|uniref:hypothetical protein n=1 Tax=Microbacterium sp. NPDC077663 TaxID=3364189 RepID=UPI0037C8E9B2
MSTEGVALGIRIKEPSRPSHAVVVMTRRLSDLIEAAAPIRCAAEDGGLDATTAQLDRIIAHLDVLRTVLVVEGDEHVEVARAYADVCEDRMLAHAVYIGKARRGRA